MGGLEWGRGARQLDLATSLPSPQASCSSYVLCRHVLLQRVPLDAGVERGHQRLEHGALGIGEPRVPAVPAQDRTDVKKALHEPEPEPKRCGAHGQALPARWSRSKSCRPPPKAELAGLYR